MITESDVLKAQQKWADGIVAIGKNEIKAEDFYDLLYCESPLMKPTMAKEKPFRFNKEEIVSYFIKGNLKEDNGFALQPWTNVRFENDKIIILNDIALAVGHYYFIDSSGTEKKVEYSFGYITEDNSLKIKLHHSSMP